MKICFLHRKSSEEMDKFGLELALKVHEADIKSKKDKISIVIHWCLLKKGLNFCGLGDNFSEDDGKLSEILPSGWNQNSLWKYRELTNKPNKFVLKIIQDGEILNVILVRNSDEVSKDLSVDLEKDVVNAESFPLVKEDEFLQKVFDALLKDFFPDPKPASVESELHAFSSYKKRCTLSMIYKQRKDQLVKFLETLVGFLKNLRNT